MQKKVGRRGFQVADENNDDNISKQEWAELFKKLDVNNGVSCSGAEK